MSLPSTPGRPSLLGIGLVSGAMLLMEILLTRLFSVTLWYHFAYFSVSLAMFGLTAGALIVFFLPGRFPVGKETECLAQSAMLFGLSIPFSLLTFLAIPFPSEFSLVGLHAGLLTTIAIAIPFIFAGVYLTLALTRYPDQVGLIYAADLAGAALACFIPGPLLSLSDGPTAILTVGVLGCTAALLNALDATPHIALDVTRNTAQGTTRNTAQGTTRNTAQGAPLVKRKAYVLVLVLMCGLWYTAVHRTSAGTPLIRIQWEKGVPARSAIFETWNLLGRTTVYWPHAAGQQRTGWGISKMYNFPNGLPQVLNVAIDSEAGTLLTKFTGQPGEIEHLRFDAVNMAHEIRTGGRHLVIGVGGGRDVLAAIAYGQKSTVGLELNDRILDVVNRDFGDFTGHLTGIATITMVADEARSWIARSRENFDLIQISMIDTWAATTAGAYVLAENGLYTLEAWQLFLNHLEKNGVLSLSRWYCRSRPDEVLRSVVLACAVLRARGVTQPQKHLFLIRNRFNRHGSEVENGIGSLLVSPDPFSEDDQRRLARRCEELAFDLIIGPTICGDPQFRKILDSPDLDAVSREFPADISAPTDERPFFFLTLRWRDLFRPHDWAGAVSNTWFNLRAVVMLAIVLVCTLFLTLVCLVLPFRLAPQRPAWLVAARPLLYFLAIGLGFMLFEMAQMQRLNLYLGHPVYGLTVALFVVLLGSALGSLTIHFLRESRVRYSRWVAGLLPLTLLALGVLTPLIIANRADASLQERFFWAVVCLFPGAFFLGMPFSLGMRWGLRRDPSLGPWLWGINGAASIVGSVLALILSLSFSISTTYWTGLACYLPAMFILFAAYAPEQKATPVHS